MINRPDVDDDGYWVGRLDDAPIGAKIYLSIDGNDHVFEILRRDHEGVPDVMETDF